MVIVSGLSGAGKTVALNVLEDVGYYCIDNLPINLLPTLYEEQKNIVRPLAVGVDIRSQVEHVGKISDAINSFCAQENSTRVIFLIASQSVLVKRFSVSQRKHPLSTEFMSLAEAIAKEMNILAPLEQQADFKIDTSRINIYELREKIENWLVLSDKARTTITLESFGFKNGVPIDADLMFDVRFLPNPHWESDLRQFTGKHQVIQDYLARFEDCERFIEDTVDYLTRYLPIYLNSYRRYLTIAIGCTGGKHRSVYITEKIASQLGKKIGSINIYHRDLAKNETEIS